MSECSAPPHRHFRMHRPSAMALRRTVAYARIHACTICLCYSIRSRRRAFAAAFIDLTEGQIARATTMTAAREFTPPSACHKRPPGRYQSASRPQSATPLARQPYYDRNTCWRGRGGLDEPLERLRVVAIGGYPREGGTTTSRS